MGHAGDSKNNRLRHDNNLIPPSVKDRNAQVRFEAKQSAQQISRLKPVLDVLKILPHGLQARLVTPNGEVIWSGLDEDSLRRFRSRSDA